MKKGDEVLSISTGELVRLERVLMPGAEGVHLALVTRESEPGQVFWAGIRELTETEKQQ